MNKSRQLTDGALLVVIFIGMMLITAFVPVISLFTMLVIAVPFVIFAAKYDWKPAIIMLIIASLLTILFASVMAIPLPILAGLGGIMIGSAIHREHTPYETWARGTLGFALGILFAFLFTLFVLDINVIDEFHAQIDEMVAMSEEMMADLGMGLDSEAEFDLLKQQLEIYKQLIPFGIVFISILLALLNQWVSYKILNRMENKRLLFPKFRNLQFPTAVVWIYLLAIIVTLFQKDLFSPVMIAAQNVLMLIGIFMAIQGLSFIFFLVHHKNLTKAIPIIAVILTVLFAPLVLPLMRILGIIDIGFGLRKRLTLKK